MTSVLATIAKAQALLPLSIVLRVHSSFPLLPESSRSPLARLHAIDCMRGLVMLLMIVDHALRS